MTLEPASETVLIPYSEWVGSITMNAVVEEVEETWEAAVDEGEDEQKIIANVVESVKPLYTAFNEVRNSRAKTQIHNNNSGNFKGLQMNNLCNCVSAINSLSLDLLM